jgi:hypothetical protein
MVLEIQFVPRRKHYVFVKNGQIVNVVYENIYCVRIIRNSQTGQVFWEILEILKLKVSIL